MTSDFNYDDDDGDDDVLAHMEKYMFFQSAMHLIISISQCIHISLEDFFSKIKLFIISEYGKKCTAFACPKHVWIIPIYIKDLKSTYAKLHHEYNFSMKNQNQKDIVTNIRKRNL